MRASFSCQWNPATDLFEISSPSGHVLYESPCGEAVAEICQRLNYPWEPVADSGIELAADDSEFESEFSSAWNSPELFAAAG